MMMTMLLCSFVVPLTTFVSFLHYSISFNRALYLQIILFFFNRAWYLYIILFLSTDFGICTNKVFILLWLYLLGLIMMMMMMMMMMRMMIFLKGKERVHQMQMVKNIPINHPSTGASRSQSTLWSIFSKRYVEDFF